jgi:hypothetical protein
MGLYREPVNSLSLAFQEMDCKAEGHKNEQTCSF